MALIEDEYRALSVVPGRMIILSPEHAIALVRRCREKQVKVLGIDGFHITPDAIQPDMGENIDLSRQEYRKHDCWAFAESFLNARLDSGLFFEVVADE